MTENVKFNPFDVGPEELEIKDEKELAEAKKEAGVKSENEYLEGLSRSGDPKLAEYVRQRQETGLVREYETVEQAQAALEKQLQYLLRLEQEWDSALKAYNNELYKFRRAEYLLQDKLRYATSNESPHTNLSKTLISFREELNKLPRTLFRGNIKEKYRNRAGELQRKIEDLDSEIKNLPTILSQLGITKKPEEITLEEIRVVFEQKKRDLWEQMTAGKTPISKQELRTRALELPIIAQDTETGKFFLKDPDPNIGVPSEIAYLAYGGTSYNELTRNTNWNVHIDEPFLGDRYGLSGLQPHEPIFGVGQKKDKKFVIVRELVNREARSGYAYTLLFDPGKEVWQKAGWNGALIVKNLYGDPVLRQFLIDRLWQFRENIPNDQEMNNFFSRLLQTNWKITPVENTELSRIWLEAGENMTQTDIQSAGLALEKSQIKKPSPGQIAQALESIPIETRKKVTFLFGGGLVQGGGFGSKVIWDWER